MSREVEKCPILHVRPKFDVFTLFPIIFYCKILIEISANSHRNQFWRTDLEKDR